MNYYFYFYEIVRKNQTFLDVKDFNHTNIEI